MLISCLIPTFNRAATLERAIRSVLGQSYCDLECIVIDDGSTDKTQEVLQLINDDRLRILKLEKNNGVSHARNQGAALAKGEWLAFLDSDDEWLPQKLEWQCRLIESDPSLHLVHGEEIWIRNGVRVNQRMKHKKGGGDQFFRSLELCLICPSTTMMRAQVFRELGGFREDFEVCEDYDLWLRFLCRYPVGFVDRPVLMKYGGHADQLSTRFKAMDDWRIRSLLDLLCLETLSIKQGEAVVEEICRKGQILSIGYEKHQRPKDRQRVEGMIEQAQYYLKNHLKESP